MEFRVPELGEGVYEAELVEWLVTAGQTVRRGDALAEVMTDKATLELPAPFSGTIETLLARPGEAIGIGQTVLRYSRGEDARETNSPEVSATAEHHDAPSAEPSRLAPAAPDGEDGNGAPEKRLLAAPAVRRFARNLEIDLREVAGSGPDGRILIDDLAHYVRRHHRGGPPRGPRSTGADLGRPGQRMRMQGLRRSIAEHMVQSKRVIPHYSYVDECDVSNMVTLRNQLKRRLYRQGVKLTNLPFYVKAVVAALKQIPIINASLDEEKGEIVLHSHYHIGIATATAKGLMVPVIRDADRKNLAEIAADIERLIRAAQAGSIGRRDLRGGTFTISSVGNFGGLVSTPIIHHPEVGIVAIGRIFKRPTYNEHNEISPAHIAYLSFSFDHRVVDGSVGAMFGNAVIQHLQHPQQLATGLEKH